MSALVESAFTVRKPAWWDLDSSHDHDENPESIEQVLEWAGANWEPVKVPTFSTTHSINCDSKDTCFNLAVAIVTLPDSRKKAACAKHALKATEQGLQTKTLPVKQMPGFEAVRRDDTGEVLAVTNDTYELYSNRATAELVEILLESDVTSGGVKFETGGVLKGGRLVWFLARLDSPVEIKGDASPIYPYISILNSHDGTAALRAINTSIRIVCWNTWQAAESEATASGRQFSFRHTSTIHDRVQEAREMLLGAQADTEKWAEYAEKYIAIPLSDSQIDMILQDFVPMPPTPSDRVVDNVNEARNAIKRFHRSASCASIAGTAYGLMQATGEYLDHGRTFRTAETYVSRTMLKPEVGKLKIVSLIDELVNA